MLKRIARLTGLELKRSYLNLDGEFDSKSNRKVIFNAGMIPNIKENPRNRQTTKRGRKRLFSASPKTRNQLSINGHEGYRLWPYRSLSRPLPEPHPGSLYRPPQ